MSKNIYIKTKKTYLQISVPQNYSKSKHIHQQSLISTVDKKYCIFVKITKSMIHNILTRCKFVVQIKSYLTKFSRVYYLLFIIKAVIKSLNTLHTTKTRNQHEIYQSCAMCCSGQSHNVKITVLGELEWEIHIERKYLHFLWK